MKIKNDIITNILDRLSAKAEGGLISVTDVVAAVHEDTGVEVPDKAVRAALAALAEAGECSLDKGKVQRYSPAQQAVWKRADELAALLGGEAEHYLDEKLAAVTFTIEGAERLLDYIDDIDTTRKSLAERAQKARAKQAAGQAAK